MTLPLKGVAYSYPIQLSEKADQATFLANPTIAAGDFKVSQDYGGFANLTTLPSVSPAGSKNVRIDLSATEMLGDKIVVIGSDVAGDEWQDIGIILDLPAGTIETALNILEGDHTESSTRILINKKNTTTPVLDKVVTGSLLDTDITINSREP